MKGPRNALLACEGQLHLPYPESICASSHNTDSPPFEPGLGLMPRSDETNRLRQAAIDTGKPSLRAFYCAAIVLTVCKLEFFAESFPKPIRCERAVPMGRLDPGTYSGQQVVRHCACSCAHAEQV